MRMLIHGSEHPRHSKTFASILASFSSEDEGLMLISNQEAKATDFTPSNFILHKLSFHKIPLLITEDSIKQLKNDNIVSKKFLGFEDFGIKPKSMDLILPSYLKHYRPRGNFSDL